MSNARFTTIPATTTLADLALIQANWDKVDSEMTRIEGKEDAAVSAETSARQTADAAEAQARASEDASLQTQITQEATDRAAADAAHAASTAAHSADHITYSGSVTGQTNVKGAIDTVKTQLDQVVATPNDGNVEISAARVGVDGTVHATLGDRLDPIEQRQLAAAIASTTLKHGWNYLLTNDASPLSVTVQGKTLANILGKDGGCESLTGLGVSGTAATSTTQVKQGSNSIKTTASSSDSYAYKDYTYSLDTAKQYVLAGWVYVESFTSGSVQIRIYDANSSNLRYAAAANTATVGSWQFIYVKIPTANTIVGSGFRLLFGSIASTAVAYFDGIRLYELDLTTYNAIGSTYTASTSPSIDDILPYVDSVKHLQGVAITKPGKNLLPPFTDSAWTHGFATPTGPYELTWTNATGTSASSDCTVTVLPSTTYTAQATMPSGVVEMQCFTSAGATVGSASVISAAGGNMKSVTFTTAATAATVRYRMYPTVSGTFVVTNPQLEFGSAATAFVARNDDFIMSVADASGNSLKLASNVDGSVKDSLYYRDGAWRKEKRWLTDMTLDGSLAWSFLSDDSGVKVARVTLNINATPDSFVAVKYNGYKLGFAVSNLSIIGKGADVGRLNSNTFDVTLSDQDTGFDNAYIPSNTELSGTFNGWKVNSYTAGTTATNEASGAIAASGTYTLAHAGKYKSVTVQKSTDNVTFVAATEGTDYTANWNATNAVITNPTAATLYYQITYTYGVSANSWASVVDGSTPATNTLAYVSVTKAANYTPYSLTYQLATTTEEVVTVEGSIDTNPGGNQIEVAEGYVVREQVIPGLYSGYYKISSLYNGSYGLLKNRNEKIIAVYKNGVQDKQWTITTDPNAYGKQIASIAQANFDPTAVYTVTYQIMSNDRGAYTANTVSVTGSYNSTQKDILDNLNKQMADTQTSVSVLQEISARKTQGQWIAPTMQNAWVNYGGTDAAAGYMKDDFGWVSVKGRIKSGTVGSTAFTLPSGYRPKETQRFAVSSNGAFGEVIVNTDGTIVPTVGSNVSFNVQIRFRAEQ